MPPLTPLVHLVRASTFGAPAMHDIAEIIELCPAEETRIPHATLLDSGLGKLKLFRPGVSKEEALRRIAGSIVHHDASRALTVRGAVIRAGSVYSGGARMHVRSLRRAYRARDAAPVRFDRLALCTSSAGDRFFGHFMTEDIQQILLAPDFGAPARLTSRQWAHLPHYKSAFGLSWDELDAAKADQLTIFDDVAQNSLRRRRYLDLRARLRRQVRAANPGARVFLRRGSTGAARSPQNDDEVMRAFVRRGFDVVDLETTPPADLIARLLDVKVLASVEGSQLAHGVYTAAESAGICILMPPREVCVTMKDRFDALGMPCAIVVGDDHGAAYSINIDDLHRTLDLLERRLDQSAISAMSSPKVAALREAPAA